MVEEVIKRLPLKELARVGHTCWQFQESCRKRVAADHKQIRALVSEGRYFLLPFQTSTLLQTCRRVAYGLDIVSGRQLPSGDHTWIGVIRADGRLDVHTSFSYFSEISLQDNDACIEVNFTSKQGPFGLRVCVSGFIRVDHAPTRRAPGSPSQSFQVKLKARCLVTGPMAVDVYLNSAHPHDWFRGLLLMLLTGEDCVSTPGGHPSGSALGLPVRLPSLWTRQAKDLWDPLFAAGATSSSRKP
jgi:hypothetical protein